MTAGSFLFLLILFTTMFFSVKKNKLTPAAAIAGGIIGGCVFLGAGFTGIAMLGLFFFLGTLATSWKLTTKEKLGAAETNKGRRTAGQVIANGGVAGLAGLLSWVLKGQQELFQLMMAASLASATADTLSSELGTIYGKRFYNILSFKPDTRGENGVVSLEGTTLGIIGSLLIALVYSIGFGTVSGFMLIVIAGTFGNLMDSVLGASLERKSYLNNDAVNFINTAFAAFVAFILVAVF